jgi:hypothetical protein
MSGHGDRGRVPDLGHDLVDRVTAARLLITDPAQLASLEAAVQNWEAAEGGAQRKHAAVMVWLHCVRADAAATGYEHPKKAQCGCAMRHVCSCTDDECFNGFVTVFVGERDLAGRCHQCPSPRKDRARNPWA